LRDGPSFGRVVQAVFEGAGLVWKACTRKSNFKVRRGAKETVYEGTMKSQEFKDSKEIVIITIFEVEDDVSYNSRII
jgi:hypothetical protein